MELPVSTIKNHADTASANGRHRVKPLQSAIQNEGHHCPGEQT